MITVTIDSLPVTAARKNTARTVITLKVPGVFGCRWQDIFKRLREGKHSYRVQCGMANEQGALVKSREEGGLARLKWVD